MGAYPVLDAQLVTFAILIVTKVFSWWVVQHGSVHSLPHGLEPLPSVSLGCVTHLLHQRMALYWRRAIKSLAQRVILYACTVTCRTAHQSRHVYFKAKNWSGPNNHNAQVHKYDHYNNAHYISILHFQPLTLVSLTLASAMEAVLELASIVLNATVKALDMKD